SFGGAVLQQPSHLWRCLKCEERCCCIHCGCPLPLSTFPISEQLEPARHVLCHRLQKAMCFQITRQKVCALVRASPLFRGA
ncbi:unnamed protein product, partial [Durusdinium trenchii]